MVVCAFSGQRFYQECQATLCKVDYPDSVFERKQYHLWSYGTLQMYKNSGIRTGFCKTPRPSFTGGTENDLRLFVVNARPSNRYKGVQFLAVDGSVLHTPTNSDDTASFISGSRGQKPYILQHLNALYDRCSHIYMDAIVQGRRQYDKHQALCDMVDRTNAVCAAIIIADRGYESYNVFTHYSGKFLIRVKDRGSSSIANRLELPAQDEFGVPIRLALSRKQANKFKDLLGSKNMFNQLRNYTFHTTSERVSPVDGETRFRLTASLTTDRKNLPPALTGGRLSN